MNKLNKKGFTLIEMLVVIAIIAVLVAIIIPTVTSATEKASAAADAANLRSLVAEATTDMLAGGGDSTGMVHVDAKGETFTVVAENAPKSKTNKDFIAFVFKTDAGTLDAGYADTLENAKTQNIAHFAAIAAGDKS